MATADRHVSQQTASPVQHPVLRGRQPVAGVWFPADWFDEATRARRLLGAWCSGATALRFAQGDLLRYAAPSPRSCDDLPGWVLRLENATLCSAPLSAAERAALPAADVWIVSGGQVLALQLRDGQVLDPAAWLDTGPVALHDTFDGSAGLPEPVLLTEVPVRDVRAVLGPQVPPASAGQAHFLARMKQAKAQPGDPGRRFPLPGWARILAWLMAGCVVLAILASAGLGPDLLVVFVALALVAWTLWRGTPVIKPATTTSPRPGAAGDAIAPRARAQARLPAWRRWLDRFALTREVARLLGWQQAAYLRRMMAMFESGDLQEALRHAIPLGGGDRPSLGQALGVPGRREHLGLRPELGLSTSLDFGLELDVHLRQLYRRSFETLDREGRIDEAVFVLAELLQSREEALDYLERHSRFQQAAELAMAWDRNPDVIVRLQCLAGDWRRAVAVARRDNAFAGAVLQLERKWPDAAARLRAEWAQALADQGDGLGAVEAIWPLAARRHLAIDWLLEAEAAGGQLGARALVKRAVLLPHTLADCAAQLMGLRDERDLHRERVEVALAVLALRERPPQVVALVALIAAPLLADQHAGRCALPWDDLQRLLNLSGDGWLSADLPGGGLPQPRLRPLDVGTTEPRQWQAPAAGSLEVLDAAVLEDGRYLLALGEAGAIVVDRRGRVVDSFAVPVDRLVIAHSRTIALGLARRDKVWRVSRIDLVRHEVSDLGVTTFDHAADAFDGIGWLVVQGRMLRVLDTGRSLCDVLWQVPDLPGRVLALTATQDSEQLLVAQAPVQAELWRYQLPLRRLSGRDGEHLSDAEEDRQMLNPEGGLVTVSLTEPEPGRLLLTTHHLAHVRSLSLAAAGPLVADSLRCIVHGPWLLWHSPAAGTGWQWFHLVTGQVAGRVGWPGDATVRVRHDKQHWLMFDSLGRVFHLDTATGATHTLSV